MTILGPHTMGERFEMLVADATVDFTAVPVTLILDGPGGQRIILRYLNGGTDGTLEPGTHGVRFVKLPPWSATYLAKGTWQVWLAVGAAATTQAVAHPTAGGEPFAQMSVLLPRGGALPSAAVV